MWMVIYLGSSKELGIYNSVKFNTKLEAETWAAKYCQNTEYHIVKHLKTITIKGNDNGQT